MTKPKATARSKKILLTPYFFGIIVFSLAIYFRMPYFLNKIAINPDEGELLATAKLAGRVWYPYQNYTTPTFGPTWPEFLTIFEKTGFNLTFQFAHVLSFLLLVCGFLVFQVYDLYRRKKSGVLIYFVYILIDFAIFAATTSEFSFLATETLPLAIFSASLLLIMHPKKTYTMFYISGFLCALAILAKYQALPLLVISIVFIVCFMEEQNSHLVVRTAIQKFLIAVVLSLGLFTIWIFVGGGLQHFTNDSLKFSLNYTNGNVSGFGGGLNLIKKLEIGETLLSSQSIILLILIIIFIIILDSRIILPSLPKRVSTIKKIPRSLMIIGCIIVGFLIIAIPGNFFPHYLFFFLWTLQASVALVKVQINSDIFKNKKNVLQLLDSKIHILVTVMISCLIMSVNQANIFDTIRAAKTNEITANRLLSVKLSLLAGQGLSLCDRNSQVFIWGWAAEYYTYFNWSPPDDLINDPAKLLTGFNRKKIEDRIKLAVISKRTKCVFEAIGPNYFLNISPMDSLENRIPELKGYLSEHYKKIELQPSYGEVWVRKT